MLSLCWLVTLNLPETASLRPFGTSPHFPNPPPYPHFVLAEKSNGGSDNRRQVLNCASGSLRGAVGMIGQCPGTRLLELMMPIYHLAVNERVGWGEMLLTHKRDEGRLKRELEKRSQFISGALLYSAPCRCLKCGAELDEALFSLFEPQNDQPVHLWIPTSNPLSLNALKSR